ncbi:ArsR/SmtB family transcription factor [Lentilactobacillus kisonensis]|nr:helix-turn-helix domain-containing protein [Lentilactobacillus kisonensis]EHO47948.1 transcriptional regulator, ArsR family [Lentilactobacillus kisonensis F0435]
MIEQQFESPNLADISLTQLLKSLSDPTRLKIVGTLLRAKKEVSCAQFENLGKKSNLSQHYRNLRLAGLVSIRRAGRHSYLALRKTALDERFPDLIETIVNNSEDKC